MERNLPEARLHILTAIHKLEGLREIYKCEDANLLAELQSTQIWLEDALEMI